MASLACSAGLLLLLVLGASSVLAAKKPSCLTTAASIEGNWTGTCTQHAAVSAADPTNIFGYCIPRAAGLIHVKVNLTVTSTVVSAISATATLNYKNNSYVMFGGVLNCPIVSRVTDHRTFGRHHDLEVQLGNDTSYGFPCGCLTMITTCDSKGKATGLHVEGAHDLPANIPIDGCPVPFTAKQLYCQENSAKTKGSYNNLCIYKRM